MRPRQLVAGLFAVSVLLGGAACGDKAEPTPNSENNRIQKAPPTSGDVPPGNPGSGETGTNGYDTGGG